MIERLRAVLEDIEVEKYEVDDYDSFDGEGSVSVNAYVSFGRLKEAYERYSSKVYGKDSWDELFDVRIKATPPPLVPANMGDFVLCWYEHTHDDDDLNVGLVTAIYETQDGKKIYGCRHITPTRSWNRDVTSRLFTVTEDNYGGRPGGFYKIISKDEALDRAEAKVRAEAKEQMERLNEDLETLREDMAAAVGSFSKIVTKTELIQEK
jgi:hypothetical protein